jgi:hypothetical protein
MHASPKIFAAASSSDLCYQALLASKMGTLGSGFSRHFVPVTKKKYAEHPGGAYM